MLDKLYEIIFFISIFLYLLFSFFLFTHKKGNRLSNRIFAGFCLLNALYIMGELAHIFRQSVYKVFTPYLEVILESTFFLFGPFLYFYTRSMTRQKFVFKKIYGFHLIPFFLDVIYRNYRYFSQSNIVNIMIERGYFISYSELRLRYILTDVHVIIYVIASLFVLHKYRFELEKVFSSVEKIKLSWLSLVLLGYSAVQISSLSKHTLILAHLHGIWIDLSGLSMHFGSLFLALIVVLKGLKQPEIFLEIEERTSGKKYKKTALSDEELTRYSEKLVSYMESEKPFFNPCLTLDDLARAIKIPSHDISQILSLGLKENFYNFVNRYRIQECMRLLADPSKRMKTVLQILYETGFNSKSAFNVAFKKHTGMTPTEYVRSKRR